MKNYTPSQTLCLFEKAEQPFHSQRTCGEELPCTGTSQTAMKWQQFSQPEEKKGGVGGELGHFTLTHADPKQSEGGLK